MTDPEISLRITPEPTDQEAAAVAAAIALLSASSPQSSEPEPERAVSRWSLAGRVSAHNASPASGHRRWSSPNSWLKR